MNGPRVLCVVMATSFLLVMAVSRLLTLAGLLSRDSFRHPEAGSLSHLRVRSPTRAGEPLALDFRSREGTMRRFPIAFNT